MEKRLQVLAVVGDIGGAAELLPALDVLGREHDVTVMLDPAGAAKATLEKAGREWVAYDAKGGELPFCDVLAVGTSAKQADAQVALTRAARKQGVPAVWVEDLYGCGSRAVVREAGDGCVPDVMCVMDDIAAEIARRSWPGITVTVCGKPSWGFLTDLMARRADIRAAVRGRLGLVATDVLLTSWHGGEDPASERLTLETLGGFRAVPRLRLAVRLHPGMQDKQALAELRETAAGWEGFTCPAAGDIRPEELSIASDAVVGTWGSTQGYVSVLAGIPTVATAFGDASRQMQELHYPDALPPHVYAGAARLVGDGGQLGSAVSDILAARQEIAARTAERAAPLAKAMEPGAAQRVADAIRGAARI